MSKKHLTLSINEKVSTDISKLVEKEKNKSEPRFQETSVSQMTENFYRKQLKKFK